MNTNIVKLTEAGVQFLIDMSMLEALELKYNFNAADIGNPYDELMVALQILNHINEKPKTVDQINEWLDYEFGVTLDERKINNALEFTSVLITY